MPAVVAGKASDSCSHGLLPPSHKSSTSATFVIAQGSIHDSQVPELMTLPAILTFWHTDSFLNNCLNKQPSLVYLLLRICDNETMQRAGVILVIVSVEPRTTSAIFNGAFSAD
jgi:hypothetical protein